MFTTAGLQRMLSWFTGKETYNGNPLYVGLSKTLPTVGGANVSEPNNSSYARVAINTKAYGSGTGSSVFTTVSSITDGCKTENAAQVLFNEAYDNVQKQVQDWGECPYICLFSAAQGGTLLAFDTLTTALHPGNNNVSGIVVIRVGDLKLQLTNASEEE